MAAEQAVLGIGALAPGSELAAVLENLEFATVPNASVVPVLQATARQLGHAHALYVAALREVARSMAVVEPDDPPRILRQPDPTEWASEEIAAALTYTSGRGYRELHFAELLVDRLPSVYAALDAGELEIAKVRLFTEYLEDLTDPQIAVLCERLVGPASGWTTGQLQRRMLHEIHAIDPDYARRRYKKGVRERGVEGRANPDGTATIRAWGLPPTEAHAATEHVEALAEALCATGYPGTLKQIEADLFVRLLDGSLEGLEREQIIVVLLAEAAATATAAAETPDAESSSAEPAPTEQPMPGACDPESSESELSVCGDTSDQSLAAPSAAEQSAADDVGVGAPSIGPASDNTVKAGPRHGVEIRVGLGTLLELDDHPAELAGWGAVFAEEARLAVARQRSAQWHFAVVDQNGYLLHAGLTRRRPHRAGPGPGCRGGVVEMHVSATLLADLAGRDDLPAGWAALIADIADQYAHRDAVDLDARPNNRFAGRALRRHVEIRDRTCVAPGCGRSARKVDLDHTRDHGIGGRTVTGNQEPLCVRHHTMKHKGGWRLTQPSPGLFRWRSPLGQIYWTRGSPIAPDLPDPVPAGGGPRRPVELDELPF